MAQIDNVFYPRVDLNATTGLAISGVALSVTGVVTSFSATAFSSTTKLVFFDVQAQPVTVTLDGTSPAVGTRGHILGSGTNYTWNASVLANAKFIGTATTATIFAQALAV
jgi:hypothetical protein